MNDCCKEAVAQAVKDERERAARLVRTWIDCSQPTVCDDDTYRCAVHEAIHGILSPARASLSPTTPEPERLTKLEAFVAAFAARRKCDDEPDKCGFGSGPYCSQHGDPYIEDAIDAARALVATHGPGNP